VGFVTSSTVRCDVFSTTPPAMLRVIFETAASITISSRLIHTSNHPQVKNESP
jgi:hypothetical protein